MELSKSDTTAIKGIAICLMLWHHLFLNTSAYGDFSHSMAVLFKVCVALFLFVSGYGLTKQFSKLEKPYIKNTVKFLLRRYVNFFLPYWFCFVIVVVVGNLCGFTLHDAYPASRNTLKCFLLDVWGQMGYNSYLKVWWFNKMILQLYLIFPLLYLIVSNKYAAIIGLIAIVPLQLNTMKALGSVFFLVEGGLPAFYLGMLMAKWRIVPDVGRKKWKIAMLLFSVSLCVGLAFVLLKAGIGAYGAILVRALMACSIVVLYMSIQGSRFGILGFVGKYATILYLVHALFLKLIPNVIYGARFAILVFVVFMAVSLAVAMLIDMFQKALCYDKLQTSILNQIDKWL